VFDQLRRAAISVDVNIVEGYALGTAPLFRRHLRVAFGSAAEAQRLLTIANTRGYLDPGQTAPAIDLANQAMRMLYGLLRSPNLPFPSNRE
jgi:four helix bundle protein